MVTVNVKQSKKKRRIANPVQSAAAQTKMVNGNTKKKRRIANPDQSQVTRRKSKGTESEIEEGFSARVQRGEIEAPRIEKGQLSAGSVTREDVAARPNPQLIKQEKEEREQKGKEFLEDEGFFDQTRPEEQDLRIPEREGVEKLPVVGASLAALKGAVAENPRGKAAIGAVLGAIPIFGVSLQASFFNAEQTEFETLIQNPETLREVALREIQKEVIAQGITDSERFGSVIESIPVAGGLAAKFATTLENPSGNVDTIVAEINDKAQRATNMREKAKSGTLGDPFIAYEQVVQIEKDLAKMEQRIQLLVLGSAKLRANTDEISRIQEALLDAKQRAFDAKQSAAFGIAGTASDSNIFLELKELKGG